jgi:hypothetical protein
MYDESIDPQKKDGWKIHLKKNIDESFAYGGKMENNPIVGESMNYKPNKLDQSDAIFTLNMNKNFKNRVRRVDVERQQEEFKLAQMQGQGAIIQKSFNENPNQSDSMALIHQSTTPIDINAPILKIK